MKTSLSCLAVVFGLVTVLSSPCLRAAEIHDAADTGDVAVIEKLIGADSTAVNLKDKAGDLPLHHAVQKGQAKAVTLLLEKGADVNARGFDDWTPLHWAAKMGSKTLCKLLLEKGAD
ncbi:MAG: ankyrin repeat-containing protein, partial [Verrucomicrobiaceae bacterium]|nr:ankyrin repeat-containing protein [Verrucomicrobiaceae bacterium]